MHRVRVRADLEQALVAVDRAIEEQPQALDPTARGPASSSAPVAGAIEPGDSSMSLRAIEEQPPASNQTERRRRARAGNPLAEQCSPGACERVVDLEQVLVDVAPRVECACELEQTSPSQRITTPLAIAPWISSSPRRRRAA